MLSSLTLILCCQLAGEAAVAASGLPVPGPVVGMGLLFLALVVRGLVADEGGVPVGLSAAADGLLRNLALLFVPAGVGVMSHGRLLAEDGLPIAAALVGSTVATIALTGAAMAWLGRHHRGGARPR